MFRICEVSLRNTKLSTLVVPLLLIVVVGCSTPPAVKPYNPKMVFAFTYGAGDVISYQRFPGTPKRLSKENANIRQLKADNWVRIGSISVEHTTKTCLRTECTNYRVERDVTKELLRIAAEKGAGLVIVEKDNRDGKGTASIETYYKDDRYYAKESGGVITGYGHAGSEYVKDKKWVDKFTISSSGTMWINDSKLAEAVRNAEKKGWQSYKGHKGMCSYRHYQGYSLGLFDTCEPFVEGKNGFTAVVTKGSTIVKGDGEGLPPGVYRVIKEMMIDLDGQILSEKIISEEYLSRY